MPQRVPQFIEVEDKIVGPLTLKQFIYLAGAGGVSVVLFMALPAYLSLLIIAPVVVLALALAFYKVNERPFITLLETAFRYLTRGKLYIWKRRKQKPQKREAKHLPPSSEVVAPKLTQSRLKDIAWSLDVKQSIYADQEQ